MQALVSNSAGVADVHSTALLEAAVEWAGECDRELFVPGLDLWDARPDFGGRTSDDRIVSDVRVRLALHSEVDTADVAVTADSGHVSLYGTVRTHEAAALALAVAESTAGVRSVHHGLRVVRG